MVTVEAFERSAGRWVVSLLDVMLKCKSGPSLTVLSDAWFFEPILNKKILLYTKAVLYL